MLKSISLDNQEPLVVTWYPGEFCHELGLSINPINDDFYGLPRDKYLNVIIWGICLRLEG